MNQNTNNTPAKSLFSVLVCTEGSDYTYLKAKNENGQEGILTFESREAAARKAAQWLGHDLFPNDTLDRDAIIQQLLNEGSYEGQHNAARYYSGICKRYVAVLLQPLHLVAYQG